MSKQTPRANNTPVHEPLYPLDGGYGSSDFEAIAVLVRVEEQVIRELLSVTPFAPVGPYVWVEMMVMRNSYGIEPYSGGGVVIPASYKGNVGGFYAFCYVDTDSSLALGREAWGYPKKFARTSYQCTGRAATASFARNNLDVRLSVVLDQEVGRTMPEAPRYPHLLLQAIPTADNKDALFQRVLARDTSVNSTGKVTFGEGALDVRNAADGNELAWLSGAAAVGGLHVSGSFQGAPASILGIEHVSDELRAMIEAR
jgi:acetoacetate decarboxylase